MKFSQLQGNANNKIWKTKKIGVCEERETKTLQHLWYLMWKAIVADNSYDGWPDWNFVSFARYFWVFLAREHICLPDLSPLHHLVAVPTRPVLRDEFLHDVRNSILKSKSQLNCVWSVASCEFSSLWNLFSSLPRKASTQRHVKFFRSYIKNK